MQRLWGILAAAILLASPALGQTDPAKSAAPGYLVVVGQSSNRAAMGRYAGALPPIYAKHQGYYLGIGGPGRGVTWLQGPWRDRSLVLGRFPTREAVETFWWDEDYRSAVRLRDRAGVFSVLAVPSTGPTPFQGADAGFLIVMLASSEAGRADSAGETFARAVVESGGVVMSPLAPATARPLEGDTVFDRVWIAGWPSLAAREAFLASRSGRAARDAWSKAGFASAATINGVARAEAAPAAAPVRPPAAAPVRRNGAR
jgi:uncharacterized protein (DUF1330 family)